MIRDPLFPYLEAAIVLYIEATHEERARYAEFRLPMYFTTKQIHAGVAKDGFEFVTIDDCARALLALSRAGHLILHDDEFADQFFEFNEDAIASIDSERSNPGTLIAKASAMGRSWLLTAFTRRPNETEMTSRVTTIDDVQNIDDLTNFDELSTASAGAFGTSPLGVHPMAVGSVSVPASDRLVSLDDNSAAYKRTIEALETVERLVDGNNAYKVNSPQDWDQRLAELEAGKCLLRAKQANPHTVKAVLGGVLAYLTMKFADEPIGEAAAFAWSLVKSLIGL